MNQPNWNQRLNQLCGLARGKRAGLQGTESDPRFEVEQLEERQLLSADLATLFQTSFEDVAVPAGTYQFVSEVGGFKVTGRQVELQHNHPAVGPASNGQNHLELDGVNGIYVDIKNVPTTGLVLQFDYSGRQGVSAQQNAIEVFWNGSLLQTISDSGVGNNSTKFRTVQLLIPASGNSGTMQGRLEFRSNSPDDNVGMGGLLDNVRLLGPKLAIAEIADQEVARGASLQVDADLLPPNTNLSGVEYSLVTAPQGATIDANTGVVTWNATETNIEASFQSTTQVGPKELLFRAGFEDVDVPTGGYGFFKHVSGFTATQRPVEIQDNHPAVGAPSEGQQHLELDQVQGIYRNVATTIGDKYELVFDFSPRNGVTPAGNAIEVWWGGQKVRTVTADGRGNTGTSFQTYTVDLSGFTGEVNRLEFRSIDPNDNVGLGGLLDNIRLYRQRVTTTAADKFEVVVTATDKRGNSDTESFLICLVDRPVAQPPVFVQEAARIINENQSIEVFLKANDADTPGSNLTYDAIKIPVNATLDRNTGKISWTPNEWAGGYFFNLDVKVTDDTGLSDTQRFRITVNEVNSVPIIQPINDIQMERTEKLSLQVNATDADRPRDTLEFSLLQAPAGATIDNLGMIQWQPSADQSFGSHTFLVQVADGNGGFDTESFEVRLGENTDPVLEAIAGQEIQVEQSFQVQAVANDPEVPPQRLTYSLLQAPAGAMIDPVSGLIQWVPDSSQGPGEYFFTVDVEDSAGGRDQRSFKVTIADNDAVVLRENSDFESVYSHDFVVDESTKTVSFSYLEAFDESDDFVNDAFEVALLDDNGNSLVHVIQNERDSFFNLSEGQFQATGVNTVALGQQVKLDLSHLAVGTEATLVFRLVNNDSDTDTQVTISEIKLTDEELNTPVGRLAVESASSILDAVDTSQLTDVTGSVKVEYGVTSFDKGSQTLFADLVVQNISQAPLNGPFVIAISNISDPSVAVVGATGRTINGQPYYLLLDEGQDGTLAAGDRTTLSVLEFLNPDGVQFDYDLQLLAMPNRGPVITSSANLDGTVDQRYQYQVVAVDPDLDSLEFQLLMGPAAMTIDSASGLIRWQPTADDVGNHSVQVQVADGRGGFDQQKYRIEVLESRPNRPPVIVSSPVVETTLASRSIPSVAEVAVAQNLIRNGDFSEGNVGFRSDLGYWPSNITYAATYDIVSNPRFSHPQAHSYTDNTTGDGLMMAVNGSTTAGQVVWEQTIAVEQNTDYDFATFISTWYPASPANLEFTINGVSVGELIAPQLTRQWVPITATWNSENATVATIQIRNQNLTYGGNDFALDDLYFGTKLYSEIESNYIELTPTDVGSEQGNLFSTLPSEDPTLFGFSNDARVINFDVDPFGNPIASGTTLTTEYESLGVTMNNVQVSSSVYGGPASPPNTTYTAAVASEGIVFQFQSPMQAVGVINTSPDRDLIQFYDLDGNEIYSTTDQRGVPTNYNIDRFVGFVSDADRPIGSMRILNTSGNLELDELIFVPLQATYEYQVEAIDPDSDPLSYQLETAPDGMFIHQNTGKISWNPTGSQVGKHSVKVNVDDGRGGIATQSYEVRVLPDPNNNPPTIVSVPPTAVVDQQEYRYQLAAVDSDNDPLRWTLLEGPEGMSIDPVSGVLTWNTVGFLEDSAAVTVQVVDGRGGLDQQTWDIEIYRGETAGVNGTVVHFQDVQRELYLNQLNMSVALGESMSAEPFQNLSTEASLANIIDALSNDEPERHSQSTHVWVSGAPLELDFDFGREYDLNAFYFWNYHSESYDVDQVDLTFYDEERNEIAVRSLQPILGNITGADGTPIAPQEIPLQLAGQVRYVNARLTGTNNQVDFNNIGFTALVPQAPPQILDQLEVNGKTYWLVGEDSQTGISWRNARAFARSIGTRMAVVDNETLNTAIANAWGSQAYGMWIGLTDRLSEGVFTWDDSGEVPTYTPWANNEPSQVIGNEDTVLILGQQQSVGDLGQWADRLDGANEGDEAGPPIFAIVEATDLNLNRIVYLDQNNNGQRDINEVFTATDTNGGYQFSDLIPGEYTIRLESLAGWKTVQPEQAFHQVVLTEGEALGGINFAAVPAPIENTSPRILSQPPVEVDALQAYRYIPLIEELDGDDLLIDLPLAPAGMVIDPESGQITWTPRATQIGVQHVVLRVRDNRGGFDLQYFQIQVNEPNYAPSILSAPPLGPAGVDLPYLYQVRANDANGDTLEFSLDSAPEGMAIDEVTGVITWTPALSQIGTASVTIRVSDPAGQYAEQSYQLSVEENPPNADPVISSVPVTSVRMGDDYLYRIDAFDINGDPLTFSFVQSPAGMEFDEENWLITWQPGGQDFGSQPVTIEVDDGRGGVATQTFTVEVTTQPVNFPPTITTPPITSAIVNQDYQFQAEATDRNNDVLFWLLVESPVGMTVDSETGLVNWQPVLDDLGVHQVVLQVSDPSGAYAQVVYNLSVRSVNAPPVIQSVPPTLSEVGSTYLYQVDAVDVDQDQLSYSLAVAPDGMSINPNTGQISWSPDSSQVGISQIQVVVTDPLGAFASQTFEVVVGDGTQNHLPVITSTPGFFATVGQQYLYQIEAEDPDGDTLEFVLLNGPAGIELDSATGLLTFTPSASDLGTTIVEVAARDPQGGGSLQSFSLTVAATNSAPVIQSIPPTQVLVGQSFRYDILASDAENDYLAYEIIDGPDGMLVDGLGRMFWVPESSQLGNQSVLVRVTDARGAFAQQSFDLQVVNDTTGPSVAILLNQNPVNVGSFVDIRVTAVDDVAVDSLQLQIEGEQIALDANGQARVLLNEVGSILAVATATDAAGNIGTDMIEIFVADPNDQSGPVIEIASPADGGLITEPTEVIGSVSDETLVSWRLSLANFGSNDFNEIGSGTEAVNNASLGKIDPTLLRNNSYILRLDAIDASGNISRIEQFIEVAGDLKLGNYQLTFQDLSVQVGGLAIEVVRQYDSLKSDIQGDFGYGWSLSLWDTNLTVNLPETGMEQYGVYTPMAIGTRVYVTGPNGQREGFTFTPEIFQLPGFGNSLTLASPKFTPDAGNTSKLLLRQNTGNLIVNEYGELTAGGGFGWNPLSPDFGGGFILETAEGTRLTIDGLTGVTTKVTTRNGDHLTLTQAGITSTTGETIQFQRDTLGRITSIIDFLGSERQYEYDSLGNLTTSTDFQDQVTDYRYLTNPSHYLNEVIDPLGRTGERIEYDENGRLRKIIDAAGEAVEILIDPDSQVVEVVNALGHKTTKVFDDRGNLTSETDPLGHTTTFEYDANGFVSKRIDALGNETEYVHDQRGNMVQMTDANGNTSLATFDSNNNVLSETDPLGNTTTYQYDSDGNLTRIVDALGREAQQVFNEAGDPIRFVDPAGNETHFEYEDRVLVGITDVLGTKTVVDRDANGNLLSEQYEIETADGLVTRGFQYVYDANGKIIGTKNFEDVEAIAVYNAAGQLIRTEGDGKSTSTVEYDERGLPKQIAEDDRIVTIEKDALGQSTRLVTSEGIEVVNTYDPVGRITQQSVNGVTVSRDYDALGRLIRKTNSQGEVIEYSYDAVGNWIEQRDLVNNVVTTYAYDEVGRVTQVLANGVGRTNTYDDIGRLTRIDFTDDTYETFEYDILGNIVSWVSREGQSWHYAYNALGEVSQITDPMGKVASYHFDAAGFTNAVTDPMGRVTSLTYDGNGNLASRTLPEGQTETTEYDAAGKMISHTDLLGQEFEYSYDSQHRLSEIRLSNGDILESREILANDGFAITDAMGTTTAIRNNRGRLQSWTSTNMLTVDYFYDARNQLTGIQSALGSTDYEFAANGGRSRIESSNGEVISVTYDVFGLPLETTYSDGSRKVQQNSAAGNVVAISFYDASDSLVFQENYVRDAADRIVEINDSSGRKRTFGFDLLGRLISETTFQDDSQISIVSYEYDAMGNRIAETKDGNSMSAVYDENDQILSYGSDTFEVDAAGNLIGKTSSDKSERFVYDELQRMVRYERLGADPITINYTYDWNGLLASRDDGDSVQRYIWDLSSPLQPFLYEVVDEQGDLIRRYFNDGENYVAYFENGQTYQLVTDQVGSIIGVFDGSTYQQVTWDAFGRLDGDLALEIGFAAGLRDSVSGLTYFSTRWYDANTGRFLQKDSAVSAAADPRTFNRFVYSLNDPVNLLDPSGQTTLIEQLQTFRVQATIATIGGIAVANGAGEWMLRKLTGGAVNFDAKNLSGTTRPFVEFGIGLSQSGKGANGRLSSGFGIGLSAGLEIVELRQPFELFGYIGTELSVSAAASVNTGKSQSSASKPLNIGSIFDAINAGVAARGAVGEVFDTPTYQDYTELFVSLTGGATFSVSLGKAFRDLLGIKGGMGAGIIRQLAWSPVDGSVAGKFSHTRTDFKGGASGGAYEKGADTKNEPPSLSFQVKFGIGFSWYWMIFDDSDL